MNKYHIACLVCHEPIKDGARVFEMRVGNMIKEEPGCWDFFPDYDEGYAHMGCMDNFPMALQAPIRS